MRIILIVHIFCLVFSVNIYGQNSLDKNFLPGNQKQNSTPDIIFDHLTEKEGLSYNNVTDMLRDKDGYLWIATTFGLNRYDGSKFDVFKRNRKDSSSLINNLVTALCEDKKGNIWGSTEEGIFCYDKFQKSFKSYRHTNKAIYPRLHSIVCDKREFIWAGCDYGLVKLDPNTKVFEYYTHNPADLNSISHSVVGKRAIAFDHSENGLWIATANGLNFFNFESKVFSNFRNTNDTIIFNNHNINALHLGRMNVLWMFDEKTKEIIGINTKIKKIVHRIYIGSKLKNPVGGNIFETSNGFIWYSSNNYETIRIDINNAYKTEIFKNDVSDPTSIIGDYVSSAWEDSDKTIWLGTVAGISRFNLDRMFYRIINLADKYPELDNNWQITCLAQNPKNGEWWLGTRDGKIYIHDPIQGKSRIINILELARGKGEPKFIVDIEFFKDLALICSVNQPAFQYNARTNEIQKFYGLTKNYENYKVRVMTLESDSTYILSNNFNPLLRWNFKSNSIKEINFFKSKDPDSLAYSAGWLHGVKDKGTWMAAHNSSAGYLHPGDTLIYPIDMKIGLKIGEGGYFNSLGTDIFGNMYFSYSNNGIYKISKLKEKVETINDVEVNHWDSSNGLISDAFSSSTSDIFGNIWCASLNKFSILDPQNNSIYNFKISLSENNTFYYNYLISLSNGHMLTNIKGNLIEFYPENMKRLYPDNNPTISKVKMYDKIIYLFGENKIVLNSDENFISISYGSLTLDKYFPYFFQYKMDGVNSEWVDAGLSSEAVYSNLPGGTYTFRVKMYSYDKVWESEEKTLMITIKTPFYKSWWFYLILILSLGGLLFYGIRSRLVSIRNINMLKTKTQLLEKEKTAVMYENLKQHLNPHFLFNSLTSLSGLIRMDPKQATVFLEKMSKVYRYILRNKDIETVPLVDELNFVEMYIQLQKTRFEEGLIIKNKIGEDFLHRKIVPVTLQNLIENAIKHNTASIEDPLIIDMYIEDDYLIVSNNLQKKSYVETSNKQGQNSMISLYRFLSQKPIVIEENTSDYIVKIPLI
jgi:sensor histidine kinase YesM